MNWKSTTGLRWGAGFNGETRLAGSWWKSSKSFHLWLWRLDGIFCSGLRTGSSLYCPVRFLFTGRQKRRVCSSGQKLKRGFVSLCVALRCWANLESFERHYLHWGLTVKSEGLLESSAAILAVYMEAAGYFFAYGWVKAGRVCFNLKHPTGVIIMVSERRSCLRWLRGNEADSLLNPDI